jgi:hypothetical protein
VLTDYLVMLFVCLFVCLFVLQRLFTSNELRGLLFTVKIKGRNSVVF